MKQKRMKALRLVRPSDAFLPMGFLAAALFSGRDSALMRVFLAFVGVRLLALGVAPGVRMAFAEQPSMRSVRGSVKAALIAQACAGALVLLPCLLPGLPFGVPYAAMCAAGTLLNVEHIFYEYLYAAGEGRSAALCRAITTSLTVAGLLLGGCGIASHPLPQNPAWLVGMAALSAATSAVIGLSIGGGLKGGINAQVFRCAPRSMLQSVFYCAVGYAAHHFRPFGGDVFFPFFAGLTIYELCRTPFRRSPSESRAMNRALLILCAVSLLFLVFWLSNWILVTSLGPLEPLRFILENMPLMAMMVIVGSLCAFVMFGNAGGRET